LICSINWLQLKSPILRNSWHLSIFYCFTSRMPVSLFLTSLIIFPQWVLCDLSIFIDLNVTIDIISNFYGVQILSFWQCCFCSLSFLSFLIVSLLLSSKGNDFWNYLYIIHWKVTDAMKIYAKTRLLKSCCIEMNETLWQLPWIRILCEINYYFFVLRYF
jgi:hypothetical protein